MKGSFVLTPLLIVLELDVMNVVYLHTTPYLRADTIGDQ